MDQPKYDFQQHEGENGLEYKARVQRQIAGMDNDRNEWANDKLGSLGRLYVLAIVLVVVVFIGAHVWNGVVKHWF